MSAVPALKLLKQICLLLGDSVHDQPQDPAVDSTSEMGEHSQHSDVISLLHTRHDIVRSVIDDLSLYMQTAGDYIRGKNRTILKHSKLQCIRFNDLVVCRRKAVGLAT